MSAGLNVILIDGVLNATGELRHERGHEAMKWCHHSGSFVYCFSKRRKTSQPMREDSQARRGLSRWEECPLRPEATWCPHCPIGHSSGHSERGLWGDEKL